MTGVVKAVAHGASPRQNHAGYLPTRAINNMAGTSTPYTPGGPGRQAGITSHGSAPGAQQHQEATPGGNAGHAPPGQDQLKISAWIRVDGAAALARRERSFRGPEGSHDRTSAAAPIMRGRPDRSRTQRNRRDWGSVQGSA